MSNQSPSVCARGLDVKKLVLVVNYDCPNHYEDYVHRYEFFSTIMPTRFFQLCGFQNTFTFSLLIFNIIVGLVESNNWIELQRGRKVFSGGHLSFPSVHCAQSRPHREGGQRGVRFHLHYQGAGSQMAIRSCEDGEAVLISIVFTRTFAQAIF